MKSGGRTKIIRQVSELKFLRLPCPPGNKRRPGVLGEPAGCFLCTTPRQQPVLGGQETATTERSDCCVLCARIGSVRFLSIASITGWKRSRDSRQGRPQCAMARPCRWQGQVGSGTRERLPHQQPRTRQFMQNSSRHVHRGHHRYGEASPRHVASGCLMEP